MKLSNATLAYCCAVISFAQAASAQAPVAIVEEIDSKTATLEFMDYLRTGQLIRLGERDRLVIGYFNSCWREVIIGGTRSEEHTSELQSLRHLVCRLLLEK